MRKCEEGEIKKRDAGRSIGMFFERKIRKKSRRDNGGARDGLECFLKRKIRKIYRQNRGYTLDELACFLKEKFKKFRGKIKQRL